MFTAYKVSLSKRRAVLLTQRKTGSPRSTALVSMFGLDIERFLLVWRLTNSSDALALESRDLISQNTHNQPFARKADRSRNDVYVRDHTK